MIKPEDAITLDDESRRLDEWFMMLGALSNCLWYSSNLSDMLAGFCQVLVNRAGYLSAELEIMRSSGTKIESRQRSAWDSATSTRETARRSIPSTGALSTSCARRRCSSPSLPRVIRGIVCCASDRAGPASTMKRATTRRRVAAIQRTLGR